MGLYKVADVVFSYRPLTKSIEEFLSPYAVSGGNACFEIKISKEDLFFEKNSLEEENNGEVPSVPYCESLAFHRKLCTNLLRGFDAFLFHASAIAYKGKAYLFTARSGTGKSTHSALWKKYLGDEVTYINDDKPIIRLKGDKFYVYGTPFSGKHRLSNNLSFPLAAICKINRGKVNSIAAVDSKSFLATLFNQSIKPSDKIEAEIFTKLLDKLALNVPFYDLFCDMSFEAFETSFRALTGEEYENK